MMAVLVFAAGCLVGFLVTRYRVRIVREWRLPDDADFVRVPLAPAPNFARVELMRRTQAAIPKHPKVSFYGDETGLEARRRVWGKP